MSKHFIDENIRIWVVVAGPALTTVFVKTRTGFHQLRGLRAAYQRNGGEWRSSRLARWLVLAEQENAFDRLVIVGATPTLASLRCALSPRVHLRVAAEVIMDAAGFGAEAVEDRLAAIF